MSYWHIFFSNPNSNSISFNPFLNVHVSDTWGYEMSYLFIITYYVNIELCCGGDGVAWFQLNACFTEFEIHTLKKRTHGKWGIFKTCSFNQCLSHVIDSWARKLINQTTMTMTMHRPFGRYVQMQLPHAPGMPGTFSTPSTSKKTAS